VLHYSCIMSKSQCRMKTLFNGIRWNSRRVYLSYHCIHRRMIKVLLCWAHNGVVYKVVDGMLRLCAWIEQVLEI
jgi:hypothetical protein